MSERKKRLEKKLTMKMMDDDFNERTSFFRVVSPRASITGSEKSLHGIDVMSWLCLVADTDGGGAYGGGRDKGGRTRLPQGGGCRHGLRRGRMCDPKHSLHVDAMIWAGAS